MRLMAEVAARGLRASLTRDELLEEYGHLLPKLNMTLDEILQFLRQQRIQQRRSVKYATAEVGDTKPVNRKVKSHGLKVVIEHPKGTIRELHDDDGKLVYRKYMFHHYGYFPGTKGRDGDGVDVFLGPVKNAKSVFVVHMKDMGPRVDEREDEDKVMLGWPSADLAKNAFLKHYPANFFGSMTTLDLDEFKKKMETASLPYRRKKITAELIHA